MLTGFKKRKKIRRFAFSSFIILNTRAHSTGDWAITTTYIIRMDLMI